MVTICVEMLEERRIGEFSNGSDFVTNLPTKIISDFSHLLLLSLDTSTSIIYHLIIYIRI